MNKLRTPIIIIFLIIVNLSTMQAYAQEVSAEKQPIELQPQQLKAGITQNNNIETFDSKPNCMPQILGIQFESINQMMPTFHSRYEGANSLSNRKRRNSDSQIYGVYLGSQITKRLQGYADVEWFKGNGISDGTGLGGYVNGDMIRAGSSDLPDTPYLSRLYLKYTHELKESQNETVEKGIDQLPGKRPIERIDFKIGKVALSDDFDQNRYANSSRNRFFNYDFMSNPTWDYAAEVRGYTYGVTTSLNQPKYKWTSGIYMLTNTGNGAYFDFIDPRELGYNTELTLKPNKAGSIIRLLSYINEGKMGNYNDAVALSEKNLSIPDLISVEKQGNTKYGFGLNFEQPLLDDGETGIFGRLGWNNGKTENWCYTEVDRTASFGAQISGTHWKREKDRVGVAYGVNGLSRPHRNYLAKGGSGILLGDGSLNYGFEQVIELYYRFQVGGHVQITPDFQLIGSPGYNSSRGPAEVFGLRVNLSI